MKNSVCLIAALILGLLAAWNVAMPANIAGFEKIGGCNKCISPLPEQECSDVCVSYAMYSPGCKMGRGGSGECGEAMSPATPCGTNTGKNKKGQPIDCSTYKEHECKH